MQIKLQGHGMIVSKRLTDHVNEQVKNLERFLPGIEELRVEFKRNSVKTMPPRTVQITVRRKRALLRAEEQDTDPLKAFDIALESLQRRIERYKGREILNKHNGVDETLLTAEAFPVEAQDEEEDEVKKVLRIKTFSAVPMSVGEAIEQMELLGHTFFAFMNDEDACVKIVYQRKTGGYGLLQPEK